MEEKNATKEGERKVNIASDNNESKRQAERIDNVNEPRKVEKQFDNCIDKIIRHKSRGT